MSSVESQDRISFLHPEDMPQLYTMSIEDTNKCFKVFHESYNMAMVTPSSTEPAFASWSYRGKKFETGVYGHMLTEPGEFHETKKIVGKANIKIVFLSPDFINKVAQKMGMKRAPHFMNSAPSDPRYFEAFSRFHQAMENEASLLERESLLSDAMYLLLSTNAEEKIVETRPSKNMVRLRRVRDYLVENYAQKISLDQLVQLSGMSAPHFFSLFKQCYGTSPHAFQNMLRVSRAMDFLRQGMPIKEIQVGFSDQNHLSRMFRRHTGVTLKKYVEHRRV